MQAPIPSVPNRVILLDFQESKSDYQHHKSARPTRGGFFFFFEAQEYLLCSVEHILPSVSTFILLLPPFSTYHHPDHDIGVAAMDSNITGFASPLASVNYGSINVPPQIEYVVDALSRISFWTVFWTILAIAVVYDQRKFLPKPRP